MPHQLEKRAISEPTYSKAIAVSFFCGAMPMNAQQFGVLHDYSHTATTRIDRVSPDVFLRDSNRREFRQLADNWYRDRPKGADIADLCMHQAYLSVIAMGERAVHPILCELQRKPEHWFWALNVITKQNPVKPENEGKIRQMSADWIAWGKINGYIA